MAEKKKILYIVEAMGGGVFTYIVDLANELVNKYDMYIAYAVRKQTPKNYKDYFDKRIHLIEVRNFGRAINPIKDIAAFFEIKKIAAEIKPDLIHLHSSKAGAIGRVAFDGKIPMFYTDKFRPDTQLRDAVRNELNVTDKFVIGNVGRFRYPKNHDYLIDIFAEVYKKDPNAVLVCVGTGELEDKIKEKCKMLQIDDRVKFLGFRSDVNRIMQAFDLLVMPSHFEGLPVTGVEAQAIGVPVLFATTITRDAAILPQSTYLKLSDSPDVWANKILEYKNMQRENDPHKWIEQKGYDIKKETKKLDDFYLEKAK